MRIVVLVVFDTLRDILNYMSLGIELIWLNIKIAVNVVFKEILALPRGRHVV